MDEMIIPEKLNRGDKVAIISPASSVRQEFIDGAAAFFEAQGFEPFVAPHANGPADGSFAAPLSDRLSDLLTVWQMPEVKAVVCSRGGYGAAHLLPLIPGELLRENPKWLVGFSDISALHALSLSQGVASIHGPMTRHLNDAAPEAAALMMILRGEGMPGYEWNLRDGGNDCAGVEANRTGSAEGRLVGGNVAVLNGLAATPFDLFARALSEDTILFIEDIAEPVYKIERVLCRLWMQGVFARLKGLLVGRFTAYEPDRKYPSMEAMIHNFLADRGLDGFPVAYNFPAGHIEGNMPLVEGGKVCLDVSEESARLMPLPA